MKNKKYYDIEKLKKLEKSGATFKIEFIERRSCLNCIYYKDFHVAEPDLPEFTYKSCEKFGVRIDFKPCIYYARREVYNGEE